MANIEKRGNSYRITVSNGYDFSGKKLREKTTFTLDPELTPKQQQKALDKFVFDFEEKVKNGKYMKGKKGGYSHSTIKKCHAIISSIFTTAVHWQVIEANSCDRVAPPKQKAITEM